jgi:hypothetical protein
MERIQLLAEAKKRAVELDNKIEELRKNARSKQKLFKVNLKVK